MPFSMPMWPLLLATAVGAGSPKGAPTAIPVRRRWVIVDESVRREVDESEYRAVLGSCSRVEVTRDSRSGIVTTGYRTRP
jgi:hypothetical protein